MDKSKFDFSGWATRNDIKCADGRTIRRDAFKDCDGLVVPLVWSHEHDSVTNVVGHALLENRKEGVYTYGSFNNTDIGLHAKEAVKHKDITGLSIYANKLKQNGGDVLHGIIREVSLVMAGANPGAYIDVPVIAHSEDGSEVYADEAIIYNGENLDLVHADSEGESSEASESENVAENEEAGEEANEEEDGDMEDMNNRDYIEEVFNGMTEEQQNVTLYLMGEAADNSDDNEGDDTEVNGEVRHNVFENDTRQTSLSHADVEAIFKDAKRLGSLRAAVEEAAKEGGVLAHALYNDDGTEATYGVANIDYLFPDYKSLNTPPEFIQRDNDWVSVFMDGVHHTPFSRIKSMFANITMDEARAKGYVKGNMKTEEVFSLLKRTTDPQTVYKKQKLDRDDTIDIVDFNIVAWIKAEMRIMLDEEIARAALVGDGRLAADDDKIFENHIRPVATDDPLYTIDVPVTYDNAYSTNAKNMIAEILRKRRFYKGSGNITCFVSEGWLSEMLLLEDGFGHALYADEAALARKLRVKRIVTCPFLSEEKDDDVPNMILLDLRDYNIGADKGGAVNMFEDFDIDFNQMKYLIETRCSGALIKPYSAMKVYLTSNGAPTYYEDDPEENPKAEGFYEKEGSVYKHTADTTVNENKTYYKYGVQ